LALKSVWTVDQQHPRTWELVRHLEPWTPLQACSISIIILTIFLDVSYVQTSVRSAILGSIKTSCLFSHLQSPYCIIPLSISLGGVILEHVRGALRKTVCLCGEVKIRNGNNKISSRALARHTLISSVQLEWESPVF